MPEIGTVHFQHRGRFGNLNKIFSRKYNKANTRGLQNILPIARNTKLDSTPFLLGLLGYINLFPNICVIQPPITLVDS
ncbi:unnamed protein product [Meloidogyne enterolobii]|uniref:Uncharacterized protein n=1 Tax=Meloidogyne enterolobii TaxID=390850 RepID=A0ACB1AFZ5_MELEN